MKVIKNNKISIVYKVVLFREYNIFSAGILIGFSLNNPLKIFNEADFIDDAYSVLGDQYNLDLCFPKKNSEVFVAGSFYSKKKNYKKQSWS